MSALSIRLPDSLHNMARLLADKEGVSVNHLVTLALAEKISALETEDYLAQRATRGSAAKFDAVLKKIRSKNTLPLPGDEI